MRNNSVTIAKVIAIILMVMGHSGCPEFINNYLGMMRMPLFFIMSGYCFKEKSLSDPKGYFQKRIKGIYWPYIKWALFFLFLHNLFFSLHIYNDSFVFNNGTQHLYSMGDFAKKIISITTRMTGEDQLLGGFWFLKSLFCGSLIFYFTRKIINNQLLACLLLISLSIFLSYMNWKLPYLLIDSGEFYAAFFIMFGHYYKSKGWSWENNLWFIICSLLLIEVGVVNWRASMIQYEYWQVLPYAVTSVLGTLTIFYLSHILERKDNIVARFLIYTGGFTFNVLTWHMLQLKVVSRMIIWFYGESISRMAEFPVINEYANRGWWIVYLLAGAGIPILWTYYYHRLKNKLISLSNHVQDEK